MSTHSTHDVANAKTHHTGHCIKTSTILPFSLSLLLREQRLVTSLAHPKKGTTKNAQKTPNFDFSQSRDLRQFSLLMFPYLHAKNQRICRFPSQAIWQSVHFWAIFDHKCPKKPHFEFSWQIGLCQFSRLVVPCLHTKNQKNCRLG